jgi:exosortase H (IPTLxxWG-CTERM-specific)
MGRGKIVSNQRQAREPSLHRQAIAAARRWWTAKNPVLRFAAVFALILGLFYSVTLTRPFQRTFFPAYLNLNAEMASRILNLGGHRTTTSEKLLISPRFSVDISRGCDAVEPCFLFLAAVIAFPAALKRKLPGLLLGVIALAGVNLLRIVSLYLVGLYRPGAFEFMHIEAWQVGFILLAVVLWLFWILWALPPMAARRKATV